MAEDEGFIVRLRGLPWSASQEEVANFLEDCNISGGHNGIHFTYVRDGRPSGEAYVEFDDEEELQKALTKDKHHMGKRYIDVFRSKRSEMEWVVKRSGSTATDSVTESVIRLRGLPFGCSKEEIAHFFSGLEIIPNGITLLQDPQGRTTGDAFVQFASPEIAERALSKHKERIGHRYIEIFKSSQLEVRNALNMMNRMMGMNRMGGGMGGMGGPRPGPYDRGDRFGSGGMGGGGSGGNAYSNFRGGRGRGNIKGFFDDGFDDFGGGYGPTNRGMSGMNRRGGMNMSSGGGGMGRKGGMSMLGRGFDNYESQTGHCIHMRGLPFAANEQDILDFFKPLNPVNVFIHYQSDGRASGEADVDFATHDEAKEAMSKDRATMQHRYIELFLRSTPSGGGGYGGSGGGSGGGYGNGINSGMSSGMNMGGGNPNYTAF